MLTPTWKILSSQRNRKSRRASRKGWRGYGLIERAVGDQQPELVATEAGKDVGAPGGRFENRGELLKHLSPTECPQESLTTLNASRSRNTGRGATGEGGVGEGFLNAAFELAPIEQTRERVVGCLERHFPFETRMWVTSLKNEGGADDRAARAANR